ncbi:electron transport complex subunit RsxC [Catenovulum sediminis]|uniref:Ion-translocating oxidoreductase complex subunit C n=1 Tax=Catenovulum sediminis TaxID=1740262 RepID=A0ABV1RGZ0_9ALTE
MESLVEKIKSGYMWDFPGGVYPPERKKMSLRDPIQQLPLPSRFYVTVKQHIGEKAKISVAVGDKVLKGQALTQVQGPMQLPVHAPTSGIVESITDHPIPHPSGLNDQTIIINADGNDEWCLKQPTINYLTLSKVEIVDKLKALGVAGLGGAAFPTYVKHSNSQPVEVLIINGVECEPYITSDDALMQAYAAEIVSGIEIFTHLLKPEVVVIAIENNKPKAIQAMEQACAGKTQFIVRAIPTKYPAGGEKQLIQVVTGKEVPSGGIPADIGVVTQNIGTAYAAYKAIVHGEPLIERVVTLTGEQFKKPGNRWVRIGTPVEFLLQQGEYQQSKTPRIIMGGPMMGFTLHNAQTPIGKISNCILAPSETELPPATNEQACIRCGFCADACPASLLPQQLYWHSKAKEYEKAQSYKLFDCIECGACAYVCPSEIPLVQYYRVAKSNIRLQQAEHEKAEKAKERFNARNERLEREKQERLEKHKQAAEARKAAMSQDPSAQDKVAAALARAKAKKQTDAPSPETKANPKQSAAAAIARAKAKKAKAQAQAETNISQNEPNVENTKLDANNQNLEPTEKTNDAPANSAADKAKAAIARAKAKKAAKMKQDEQASIASSKQDRQQEKQQETSHLTNNQDDKEARIKAAIAKAKAKRKQLGEDK